VLKNAIVSHLTERKKEEQFSCKCYLWLLSPTTCNNAWYLYFSLTARNGLSSLDLGRHVPVQSRLKQIRDLNNNIPHTTNFNTYFKSWYRRLVRHRVWCELLILLQRSTFYTHAIAYYSKFKYWEKHRFLQVDFSTLSEFEAYFVSLSKSDIRSFSSSIYSHMMQRDLTLKCQQLTRESKEACFTCCFAASTVCVVNFKVTGSEFKVTWLSKV